MSADNKLANKIDNKSNDVAELTHDRQVFVPATDVYEKGESIYVVCDIPGVDEKNVDISLENDILNITAHQDLQKVDNYELLHQGYVEGIYQRSFSVNEGIDQKKIKAKLNNGVLNVELPRAETLKPKKITVNVE